MRRQHTRMFIDAGQRANRLKMGFKSKDDTLALTKKPADDLRQSKSVLFILSFTQTVRLLGRRSELELFIEEPYSVTYFRLLDRNTISPQVRAIAERLSWLNANTRPAIVNVLTDSKIAIKSITFKTVTSKIVLEFINSINNCSQYGSVPIIWVPDHMGIRANEIMSSLSKKAEN